MLLSAPRRRKTLLDKCEIGSSNTDFFRTADRNASRQYTWWDVECGTIQLRNAPNDACRGRRVVPVCKVGKAPIQMIFRTLLSLTIALQALPAALAQAQSPDEADPAIGRLNHAGFRDRQHCTAALVGPSEALTAKHCVDGLAPGNLHVVLGYDDGAYSEHMRVRALQPAQNADIARLCLEGSSLTEPLPSAAASAGPQGSLVGVVAMIGYPRSQAHRQWRQQCAVTAGDGTLALLDCPAEPGMSGAPVLSAGRLVGVVSATTAKTSVAVLLAALPPGGCGAVATGADRHRAGEGE